MLMDYRGRRYALRITHLIDMSGIRALNRYDTNYNDCRASLRNWMIPFFSCSATHCTINVVANAMQ